MAIIGTLAVALTARTTAFDKGLKGAEKSLSGFSRATQRMGMEMVGLSAAILAPIGAAIKTFADYGDKIAKMSRRTGIGVEALSELGYAAETSGADIESLEKAMKRMAKGITDANSGLAGAGRAFDRVGVHSKALARMTPEAAFRTLARAIAATEDPLLRAAAAQDIFGRAGTMLLPLFDTGAEGLDTLSRRASQLGIVLDEETATKAELLADAITDLNKGFVGIGITIATNLGINFEILSDRIAKTTEQVREFMRGHAPLIKIAAGAAIVLGVLGTGLIALGTGVKALTWSIAGLRLAIAVISKSMIFLATNPMMLVILAGAALGVVITKILDKFGVTHSILQDFADDVEEAREAERQAGAETESFGAGIESMGARADAAAADFADLTEEADGLAAALDKVKAPAQRTLIEAAQRSVFPMKEYDQMQRRAQQARNEIERLTAQLQEGFPGDEGLAKRRDVQFRKYAAIVDELEAMRQVWGDIAGVGKVAEEAATNYAQALKAANAAIYPKEQYDQLQRQLETYRSRVEQITTKMQVLEAIGEPGMERLIVERAAALKNYQNTLEALQAMRDVWGDVGGIGAEAGRSFEMPGAAEVGSAAAYAAVVGRYYGQQEKWEEQQVRLLEQAVTELREQRRLAEGNLIEQQFQEILP